MVVVFSCSDVYIKLQVVADSMLDGGTEEQRHGAVMSVQCPSAGGALFKKINHNGGE